MTRVKVHQFISWGAVIVWMGLIFYLSHQPAESSSELSSGIVDIAVGVIEVIFPYITFDLDILHFYIRKGAHLFAYFMLGLLSIHALFLTKLTNLYAVFWAFAGSVVYAVSDEIHQLFIPGRSGEIRDVLIDSVGAMIGISSYFALRWIIQQSSKTSKKNS